MRILFFMLTLTLSLFAVDPLVSTSWLNTHLADDNIQIIEVSDGESYNLEHIPGAGHTTIGNWRSDNGTYLAVRPLEEIQKEVQALGIDQDTHIILYAPITTPKDLLKASYIYWALDYYGIGKVSLLDGGLNAWKKEGYPLSNKSPDITPTLVTLTAQPEKIADINYVKAHLKKLPMIDARPADKYLGITPTNTVKRNGHIEGAMSYSWNYSIDNDYKLKSIEDIQALFAQGYDLKQNEEVLVYCTGGLETSFNYFVLSGILNYKKVRLYDASMKEWGNREDTPMTKYRYETFGY